MSRTIPEQLANHYRERGASVFSFFIKDDVVETITFADLLRRSAAYAARYRQLDVGESDSIIIVLKHSPDLFYSFVGALLAGAIPSFMPFPSQKQDPHRYWSEHRKVLDRIGTRVLVTYDDNLPFVRQHFDTHALHILTPDTTAANSSTQEPVFPALDPEAVAFLQHTSGTTDLKKGIALSHRAVLNQVREYAEVLGISTEDRIASWLPLYHDMGLIACFLQPLLLGVPVVMMDPFEWVYNPIMLLDAIERYRATLVWLPNFSFQHMCLTVKQDRRFDLSSIRAFINCSEPCKPETFARFLDTFKAWGVRPSQLQTCYAMAENVFAVTQTALPAPVPTTAGPDAGQTFLSVGTPLPGIEVRIVDAEHTPVPERTVGEVAVAGNCLFFGYYKQPDETGRVLDQGWYYTGDLGFLADGHLYITGRAKDLIIVNGRNHYAHDLEFAANKVDGLKKGRVVAIGVYDEKVGSEQIVVIAETEATRTDERQALTRTLKAMLMRELDVFLTEAHLVPPGWIVKTTSGKISRDANKTKFLTERALVPSQRRDAA